jgi:hypothetical protein
VNKLGKKMCRFFLLSIIISNNAISAIFGAYDDRVAAKDHFLYSSGTIFCDGGLRGSATHIRHSEIPNNFKYSIILSAAHVLYKEGTSEQFKECVFRPQNKRLTSIGFYGLSDHRFMPSLEDKLLLSNNDLVFIALKSKLHHEGMTLGLASSDYKSLQLVGYNEDKNTISISSACQTFSSAAFYSDKLLLHDCDAGRGASGGPIIDQNSKEVIAVHGGTFYVDREAHSKVFKTFPKAQPESLINQGRRIDEEVIVDLRDFIVGLSTDS